MRNPPLIPSPKKAGLPPVLPPRGRRAGGGVVQIGAGVGMSCEDVDDDLAVVRFVYAPSTAGTSAAGPSTLAAGRRRGRRLPSST